MTEKQKRFVTEVQQLIYKINSPHSSYDAEKINRESLRLLTSNIPNWDTWIASDDPDAKWAKSNIDELYFETVWPNSFALAAFRDIRKPIFSTDIIEEGFKIRKSPPTKEAPTVSSAGSKKLPCIKVTVEYNGKVAEHYGAHFIDAISFLCHAEEAVRLGRGVNEPVDISTTEIGKQNLKELMDRRNQQ